MSLIFVCHLLAGCGTWHARPERSDRSIGLHKALITADRIVINRISVNDAVAPTLQWNRTIEEFRKYVCGEVIVNDVIGVTVPTDENGYITGSQSVDLDEVGPHSITVIFLPKMKGDKRGVCSTNYDGKQQVSRQVVRYNKDKIDGAAFMFVSKEQVWEMVLLHELGHALGVPANPSHIWDVGHCTNPCCVMYPKPDFRSVCAFFFHGFPNDFCQECRAELLSVKEQARR